MSSPTSLDAHNRNVQRWRQIEQTRQGKAGDASGQLARSAGRRPRRRVPCAPALDEPEFAARTREPVAAEARRLAARLAPRRADSRARAASAGRAGGADASHRAVQPPRRAICRRDSAIAVGGVTPAENDLDGPAETFAAAATVRGAPPPTRSTTARRSRSTPSRWPMRQPAPGQWPRRTASRVSTTPPKARRSIRCWTRAGT